MDFSDSEAATAAASNKFPEPSLARFCRANAWESLSSFSVMAGLSLFAIQLKGLLKEILNDGKCQFDDSRKAGIHVPPTRNPLHVR